MPEQQTGFPLFPLGTPLFPGGRLALRIFERRYLDLVRDCLRNDACFGVVWIRRGGEVDRPGAGEPELASYGVEARIVDWDQTQDGLLGITIEGGRRFRLISEEKADSGLHLATVDWCELGDQGDDSECIRELSPEVVEGLLANSHSLLEALASHPHVQRLGMSVEAEGIAAVVYRLAQLLPLPAAAVYSLLERATPLGLLETLHELLGEYADQHLDG